MSLIGYIYVYLLGGLTFIPIVIILFIYLHPKFEELVEHEPKINVGEIEEKENSGIKSYKSGWITVTQEYIESIDDITSTTQSIGDSAENKSAYSSLYKLVKNSETESNVAEPINQPVEVANDSAIKKAHKRHMYYAILKHGNLFLYKNENLNDVKHVIVLSNQMISMWPRNIPDGQLFTKTSAICVMKRDWTRKRRLSEDFENDTITINDVLTNNLSPPPGSIFIYCNTNIEKEDWYLGLIRATKTDSDSKNLNPSIYAKTLHFETDNMINLIQSLYSSEGQLHTKWLNAIIGRLFLSLQKTEFLREFLKKRLDKKLNKIKKPGFLDTFKIVKIDSGISAPSITWPSLKEINPSGDLIVKFFMHYHGRLSFQIATKVNINLGSRFKPREVDLLLSITIEKIEGPMILKFKPPPSERIWYSFENEPNIVLKVEPIISSRQLTYTIITNSIEKKLKEAIKDSLVLPHWDDFVFYDTSDEIYRGGIWDKGARENEKDELEPEVQESLYELQDQKTKRTKTQERGVDDAASLFDENEEVANLDPGDLSNKTMNNASSLKSTTTTNPKLRISSTLSDISKKMKRQKSSSTLGVNDDNCLSDGSLIESSKTFDQDSISGDAVKNKTMSMNTLKKLGKWYFKEDRQGAENENYTPPEMILNRRNTKKTFSDSASLLHNQNIPSYEMFNKDLSTSANNDSVYKQVDSTGKSTRSTKLSLGSFEKPLNLDEDSDTVIDESHEIEAIPSNILFKEKSDRDPDKNTSNMKGLSSSESVVSEDSSVDTHPLRHTNRKPPPGPPPKTPPQLPSRPTGGHSIAGSKDTSINAHLNHEENENEKATNSIGFKPEIFNDRNTEKANNENYGNNDYLDNLDI